LKKLGQIQDKGTNLSTTSAFTVTEIGDRRTQGSTAVSPPVVRDCRCRYKNQRRRWKSVQTGFNEGEEDEENMLELRVCLGSGNEGEEVCQNSLSHSHTNKIT